ncbi:MAG: hypothetical protein P8X67_20950 [Syntrophobacterales bacterium]
MAVLPGVLGCRPLRRTVQVRLRTNTLRLPGGTPIFVVSRQQFMKYPGLSFFIVQLTLRLGHCLFLAGLSGLHPWLCRLQGSADFSLRL